MSSSFPSVNSPGLTSKGGYLTPGLKEGQPVAIYAEGKETPCAIGVMKMSTDDIKSINKGHGIESATYLGDDLWTNAKDF
jgi:PUA domain protein